MFKFLNFFLFGEVSVSLNMQGVVGDSCKLMLTESPTFCGGQVTQLIGPVIQMFCGLAVIYLEVLQCCRILFGFFSYAVWR